MLFLSREYVDNSSDSGSAREESPVRPTASSSQRHTDDSEFSYQRAPVQPQPRAVPPVRESMPVVRNNPWMDDQPDRVPSPRRAGFVIDFAAPAQPPPMSKPAPTKEEKVGIYIPEPPKERPSTQRPGTAARPGTGNAAMRARMLEQQKHQLMGRKESMQVTAGIMDPRARLRSDQPLDMLEKMLEKPSGKTFTGFASHIGTYEPMAARREEKLPPPVQSVRTVFKEEEIEEVRLDESTAVHNTASKALQQLRRKSQEESTLPPPLKPMNAPVMVAEPPKPVIVQHHPQPVMPPPQPVTSKPTQTKPPSDGLEEGIIRKEAASRFTLEEVQHTLPQARVLGHGQMAPRRDPPPPPVPAATDDQMDRRPKTAQHARSGSMPPPVPEAEPPEALRPKPNLRVLLASEMMDMRRFLTTPVHRDVFVQCSIRREKSGLKNRFYPKYFMHLSDGYTFLLAGKKRANNKTSNYLISMNQKEMATKSPAYLGKVRSNFLGTEFILYNTGLNPSKKNATRENAREELGVVLYQSNILGTKGPRKMRVLIPMVNSSGEPLQWKPMSVRGM